MYDRFELIENNPGVHEGQKQSWCKVGRGVVRVRVRTRLKTIFYMYIYLIQYVSDDILWLTLFECCDYVSQLGNSIRGDSSKNLFDVSYGSTTLPQLQKLPPFIIER